MIFRGIFIVKLNIYYLKRKSQGLLSRSGGWEDGIQSFDQALAISLAFLALNGPSLEPGHLVGSLQHVVSVPSRNGDKSYGSGVVTDLLDVVTDFFLDFLKTALAVWGLSGVHLVHSNNKLFDTQGEGKQSMLSGLAVLGDTGFKLTSTSSNNQHSTISL